MNQREANDDLSFEVDDEEYDEMLFLERLESLREEMEELKVATLTEVIQCIEEMHRRLESK